MALLRLINAVRWRMYWRRSVRRCCSFIMASDGYPEHYEKGFPLEIPETVQDKVYIAGAAIRDGQLVTNGGRVVGCTAIAETLPEAIREAYEISDQVHFENKFCRRDIGARALAVKED